MFKETVSKLRRLMTGEPSAAEGAPPAAEERRVRVRYPSNAQTTFQARNGVPQPRDAARVRNISRSGISLVVGRRFEPGNMLSVDLPAPDGRTTNTVLACVIHATPQGEGEWTVGCTFAQELSDGVLQAFGGQRRKPSAPDDQRSWVRFPCRVKATCQVVRDIPEAPWAVEVLNISPSGIGLRVDRAIDNGTLLNLDLQHPAGQITTSMLACVVHVTDLGGGLRSLGCNFIRELSEDELQALL
jgi:hypothetical protein